MMPSYLRAGAFEYKHRYLVHGVIYTLGLAAPWQRPAWGFLQNGSSWFLLSNALAKPTYQNFALDWNGLLVLMILCASAGAWLRIWGAAYLGASTVHRDGLVGDRVVAAGPYRYTRNPLYLGTVLNTVAVAMLMRPVAAVLTICLILLVQFRLIGREESYLASQRGADYMAYLQAVPRFLPSLRPRTAPSSVRPNWKDGVLSEVYVLGCAITFAALGWSTGFAWEGTILHVLQGIVIALGLAVVARAFISRPQA